MDSNDALTDYREWLAALNARDWDQFRQHLAEDATFTFTHLLPGEHAVLAGREAIVSSFQGWQSRFRSGHIGR